MPPPTTVHLVRHAVHDLLPHTLAGRQPGVPLSTLGQAQARALAERLAEHPAKPAAIVASPVLRAQQTAAALASVLRLEVHTDAGFEEIDFGGWTGRRFADLQADPVWHAWNRLRSLTRCPAGETMHEAQSRALRSLAHWRAARPGATVVIVSHADVLKAMLAPALGLSLDHLHRLTLDPASISTLVLFDDDMRVDGVNR